ncbi:glutathione gamma-glutamylcysteinyltransferase 1-like [Salvia splendens]|uniref:glutathione gamma-glutamylcysteinyltransferase 1-like n=1 Tax=Salvia splendens TaxID=180675 RepID=UPI001C2568DB|nr:glutathione gamma-glutamylcysteinyltransferase 1-like [Salvia splendens]
MDMVLILDVARFKYPPHWVPLTLLWEAMDSTDEATKLKRGFMLVSRRQREPALLHTLSCKHDGWTSIGKYLTDDVPLLLSSHSIKDWVAEVLLAKDGGLPLSEQEKVKLEFKETVLKQVQDTSLYKHVTDALSSKNCFCKREQNSLPHTVASASCNNAREMRRTVDKNNACATKISRAEANGAGEVGVDVGSESHCYSSMHQASNHVLTVLLFALPPETWRAVVDEQVWEEICGPVSIQKLPPLLQDEVLHLRGQLFVLKIS